MPEVHLTSGVFPVPQPEGDEGVTVAVLISNTSSEEATVDVQVRRITPQGEKDTLYESPVTVPAQGGREITLDSQAVAGQMLEVTLALPSEGLDPSVAVITGTPGGDSQPDQRSLSLWVSPRDFVPVASAASRQPHQLTTGLFLIDDQRDNLSADWTYTLTLWVSQFGTDPASLPFSVRSARQAWGLMGPIPVGEGELNPPPGGATSFSMEAPQGGVLEVNVDAAAGLVPSVVVARRMPGSPNQTRLWISPGRFTQRPGNLILTRQPPRLALETPSMGQEPEVPVTDADSAPSADSGTAGDSATSAGSSAGAGSVTGTSSVPNAGSEPKAGSVPAAGSGSPAESTPKAVSSIEFMATPERRTSRRFGRGR